MNPIKLSWSTGFGLDVGSCFMCSLVHIESFVLSGVLVCRVLSLCIQFTLLPVDAHQVFVLLTALCVVIAQSETPCLFCSLPDSRCHLLVIPFLVFPCVSSCNDSVSISWYFCYLFSFPTCAVLSIYHLFLHTPASGPILHVSPLSTLPP